MTILRDDLHPKTASGATTGSSYLRRGLGLLAIGSVAGLFVTGHVSPNAVPVGYTISPVALTINKTVTGDGVRPVAGWEFTVTSTNCPFVGTVIVPSAGGTASTFVNDYNSSGACVYTVAETAVAGWTSVVTPSGPFSVVGPGAVTTINAENSSPTTTTEATTTTTTTTTTEAPTTTVAPTTTEAALVIPIVQVIPPAPAVPEAPTSTTTVASVPAATAAAATTTASAPTTTTAPVVQGSVPSGAVATPGLVENEDLALTGRSTGQSLLLGVGMVLVGTLALIATRKRTSQK